MEQLVQATRSTTPNEYSAERKRRSLAAAHQAISAIDIGIGGMISTNNCLISTGTTNTIALMKIALESLGIKNKGNMHTATVFWGIQPGIDQDRPAIKIQWIDGCMTQQPLAPM